MSPGIRIKTFFLDPFDDAYSEEKFPILLTIKFVLSDIYHVWKKYLKFQTNGYMAFLKLIWPNSKDQSGNYEGQNSVIFVIDAIKRQNIVEIQNGENYK